MGNLAPAAPHCLSDPISRDIAIVSLQCPLSRDTFSQRRKIHRKNPPPPTKSSSKQVFLNNFRWVPDSYHGEEGKSSHELFEKVRVNAVFLFGVWGFWVGLRASILSHASNPPTGCDTLPWCLLSQRCPILQRIARYLCDTPKENKHEKVLRYYR